MLRRIDIFYGICYKNKGNSTLPAIRQPRRLSGRSKVLDMMANQDGQKKTVDTNGSLEHMAVHGVAESVPEISRKLKINKVTAYKLMRTLEERKYVRKQQNGRYILTSRMFEFGSMFCNNNPLTHLFYQNANMLLKAIPTSEIYLGVLADKARGVYLGSVAVTDPYINSGTGFPLHATAIGKVLLAFATQEFQMEFFQQYEEASLAQYTASTVKETAYLAQQLRDIRKDGYCVNRGEYIMNTFFIAAPVFGPQQKLIAAVSVGSNKDAFEVNKQAYLREILAFATRLSRSMGANSQPFL